MHMFALDSLTIYNPPIHYFSVSKTLLCVFRMRWKWIAPVKGGAPCAVRFHEWTESTHIAAKLISAKISIENENHKKDESGGRWQVKCKTNSLKKRKKLNKKNIFEKSERRGENIKLWWNYVECSCVSVLKRACGVKCHQQRLFEHVKNSLREYDIKFISLIRCSGIPSIWNGKWFLMRIWQGSEQNGKCIRLE